MVGIVWEYAKQNTVCAGESRSVEDYSGAAAPTTFQESG